ncbi:hypothetical protein ACH4MM_07365 [Streptomyces pratensis]|uniref:hypothetical protein n=1 Tax=Streptomyces pratensis TaxID=1169025 RepID=UPI0037B115BE
MTSAQADGVEMVVVQGGQSGKRPSLVPEPHRSRAGPAPARAAGSVRRSRTVLGTSKKRNTVERAINRLKSFRAVATRYEKRASIYLGTVTLAAHLAPDVTGEAVPRPHAPCRACCRAVGARAVER